MKKNKRTIFVMIITLALVIISGCERNSDIQSGLPMDRPMASLSFRDVPGITAEEIQAIETLREQNRSFVYGALLSTEAFINRNGEKKGYAALLCEWLTKVFGIPFRLELYTWNDLLDGLNSGKIDFAGNLTITDERRQIYFMTGAISQRSMKYIRIAGSTPLSEISKTRLLRYALLEGSATIDEIISSTTEPFEPVYISDYIEAYELLKSEKIDALVAENSAEAVFESYDDIATSDFLPIIFSPVAITAQNPDLAPVISVVQKVLESGGIRHFNMLYHQGYREYLSHKLFMQLNEEELDFLDNHSIIPFAAEHSNYPTSFYNTREKQYQGISHDVLREIEALTGLEFRIANELNTPWPQLLGMLESADALMITELVHSPDREGRFLWPDSSLATGYSALISREDHPFISINEVYSVKVGLQTGTVHTELFNRWFPDHKNTVETSDYLFQLLVNNEVDMVMHSTIGLLRLTNFQELPGYKVNMLFDNSFESSLGFNKDAGLLCSIVNKTLKMIDTDVISGQWLNKTFDYRLQLAQAQTQMSWIISAIIALTSILVFVIILYLQNIRKRKIIADQHERAKVMLDTLPLPCCLINRDYKCLDCNSDAVRLYELSSKQEFVDRFNDLFPEHQPDGRNSFKAVTELIDTIFDGERFSGEWMHQLLDGTPVPVIDTYVRVNYQDSYAVMLYSKDMREQKRMTARIETMMDNLPGMVFQCLYNPPEYSFSFVSGGCKDLTGYAPEELIGSNTVNFFNLVHPDDISEVEKLAAETIPKGLPCEATFRIMMKDGTIKWVWERSRVTEKKPDGTPYLVEGYYTDITERRQLEIAEMASRSKTAFLANMSHEMRTPMNVVIGLTDLLLEEEKLSFNLKENLKKIGTAGSTLLGLINDVLDISKIEAGKLELTPVKYEVPSLLNDIITLNMVRIRGKSVRFMLDISGELPFSLYGDDLRVKQIINNLLSNAFKYTQRGTVTLGICCSSGTETNGNDVRMSVYVSDTGIGIHQEDLKKIFIDYTQVDTRTNRLIEGTGLGLSITKRLTELMGGEITAESEYGRGTTFRVVIRQGYVSSQVIGEETAEKLRSFRYVEDKRIVSKKLVRPDLSYARVLVVDDMQTNLDVATGLLQKYKMQVDCVLSGKEAVEQIRLGAPVYDAIFMDHMMPGMDGIETTEKIRSLGTHYAMTVPVIALTANVIAGNEQMLLSRDFQAFLSKPIDIMALDFIVQKWIRDTSRE